MPTERHCVKTYLNDEENARIDTLAAQTKLSKSELMRRLVMNQHIPSPADFEGWQAVRDLLKVNADLARLGNLLLLALDEELPERTHRKVEMLHFEIRENQKQLKDMVQELGASLKGRGRNSAAR